MRRAVWSLACGRAGVPSDRARHPLATSRWGVPILASLVVFGPISIDLYLPALPDIARAFGAGTGALQWTLSAFLAGFCLGMLVYGPVSDAVGRRPVLLFGIVLFVLASLACAFAPSAAQLIGLRFFQAVGGGAAAVMGRAIVRDIYPRHDGARILSLVALVTAITPMLAPLAGAQILRLFGWPAIFLLLALYGALVLVLAWRAVAESHPPARRTQLRLGAAAAVYGRLLADRAAWGCVLCAGGTFGAMFAYIAATPFVYIEHFGVSPQAYGLLFALNIVSQMAGTYLNSRMVRLGAVVRMSRAAARLALAGASLLLLAGLSGWGGLGLVAVALLPVIGVSVLQSSNMTARIMALYPDNLGAAAAALTSSMFGLGALSSFCVSLFNDGTPLAMGVVVFICCAIALLGTTRHFMAADDIETNKTG